MVHFPLPLLKPAGIFPQYLLWKPGCAPGGKSHNPVGALCLCPPPLLTPQGQVLTLRLVHTEQPAIYGLQFRFSSLALVPEVVSGFWSWVSALVSWDSLHLPFSLQSCGQKFALCLPLYYGFKKSCWFFCLFSFFVVMMDWRLPGSLYVEWKMSKVQK